MKNEKIGKIIAIIMLLIMVAGTLASLVLI